MFIPCAQSSARHGATAQAECGQQCERSASGAHGGHAARCACSRHDGGHAPAASQPRTTVATWYVVQDGVEMVLRTDDFVNPSFVHNPMHKMVYNPL